MERRAEMMLLDGLAPIAGRYDGFIVDLWGVIHDGVRPYPGAVACLARLRAAGKRVVLLSNAPRRAAAAAAILSGIGVDGGLYDGIVTSGEACHAALRDRPDDWFRALGTRVYHLGPARDRSVFEGLGLIEAAEPQAAQFVLNTGPDNERGPADPALFDDVLAACRAAELPMLCANPDLVVVRDGVEIACAGRLAERYAAIGGAVRMIGKPDPAIYARVFDLLGIAPARVLAIGDSLRTDIAGAAAACVDALWVLGGIHAEVADDAAASVAAGRGLRPVGIVRRLVW